MSAYIHKEDDVYIDERKAPVIYRLEQIVEYQLLETHFRIPYNKRFAEEEFRKCVNRTNMVSKEDKYYL